MRSRFAGRLSLLFLSFVALLLIFPAMAFAQSAPTIQSDKADYAPGELVTLTGSGWGAGESVHINVDDDQTKTWSRTSTLPPMRVGTSATRSTYPIGSWRPTR